MYCNRFCGHAFVLYVACCVFAGKFYSLKSRAYLCSLPDAEFAADSNDGVYITLWYML